MDNARDMVDVREMVTLQKPRLIGHTAAIEGVYYGPYWYYLLSIPFILSGGDPYAAIILQIILWVIGGYFVLKIANRFGLISMVVVGCLWVASNFVVLSSQYAFNPNPTLFFTPVFIYLFDKYLTTKKSIFSITSFAIAGMFFSSQIFFAVFMPLIIILSILLTKNKILFKDKSFWLGVVAFTVVISPQIFFDLRHDFLMTKSLINYFANSSGEAVNFFERVISTLNSFYRTVLPTFMNFKEFVWGLGVLTIAVSFRFFKSHEWQKNYLPVIMLNFILVPLLGFMLIPTTINSWHWVGVMAALLIFSGFIISEGLKLKVGKLGASLLFISLIAFSILNMKQYLLALSIPMAEVSLFKNEIKAIDYVYKKAEGKNFKVYTYMPSVIDYPYQYLFWWRGLKEYGYVPEDYAYEPSKPEYIKSKDRLNTGQNPESSNLVFLIKEPDTTGRRHLWENTFIKYPLIISENVGSVIIETRQDIK